MSRIRWTTSLVVLLALAVGVCGCGDFRKTPELHPLTGNLTRDGNPVAEGGLIFLPKQAGASGMTVNAMVRNDGTFVAQTLLTRENGAIIVLPGAPRGDYKVIYHPPGNGSKTGLEVELDQEVKVGEEARPVALCLPRDLPQGNGVPRDDDATDLAPAVKPEGAYHKDAKDERARPK